MSIILSQYLAAITISLTLAPGNISVTFVYKYNHSYEIRIIHGNIVVFLRAESLFFISFFEITKIKKDGIRSYAANIAAVISRTTTDTMIHFWV